MATRNEIREWIKRGKTHGATHVIVVVDTFSYDDYPVEVKPGEDARAKADACNAQAMQRVMEVYNLALDIEKQLDEHRAFNY